VAVLVVVPLLCYWIGTGQIFWLILVMVGAVVIGVVGGLQRHAWLLLPFGWVLTGHLGILPLPLSVRDLTVLLLFVTWLALSAFSKQKTSHRWHVVDWILLANLLWLAFTFYLHPVGMRAASSETYGGRSYWNFAIATLAYWVLIRLPDSPREVALLPHFWLAGLFFPALLSTIAYVVPDATLIVYVFYSGIATDLFITPGSVLRLTGYGALGSGLIRFLCAKYPPVSLFNPLRLRSYVFVFGLAGILVSGFRSSLVTVAPMMFLGSWFRRRTIEIIWAAVLGLALLIGVLWGQGRFYKLPQGVQRTLSFLPGDWEPEVLSDARGSTEWRFQLWLDIFRYRMINDWWRGDGFGVAQQDFELTRTNSGESLVLRGSYHSGPLTTIRNAGIIGLVLFYCLLIGGAWSAVRCVNRCRDTVLFPVAIFAAFKLLWEPIHYAFVFGSYPDQLPETIFFIGIVRLLMEVRSRMPATEPPTAAAVVKPASQGAV
jgi:hypothetical protein